MTLCNLLKRKTSYLNKTSKHPSVRLIRYADGACAVLKSGWRLLCFLFLENTLSRICLTSWLEIQCPVSSWPLIWHMHDWLTLNVVPVCVTNWAMISIRFQHTYIRVPRRRILCRPYRSMRNANHVCLFCVMLTSDPLLEFESRWNWRLWIMGFS